MQGEIPCRDIPISARGGSPIDGTGENRIRGFPMLLRKYRERVMRLTLEEAAPRFGLSRGGLGDIETGQCMPSIDKVLVIEGATGGRVSLLDHFQVYQAKNSLKAAQLRDRGRALAKQPRPVKRKVPRHG